MGMGGSDNRLSSSSTIVIEYSTVRDQFSFIFSMLVYRHLTGYSLYLSDR